MSKTPVVIAGLNAGIRVTIDSNLHPIFKNMQALSAQNHWARLSVHQLNSLTSGHFKNNIFIKENGRHEACGSFSMILPGCKATFYKTRAGEFHIYELVSDAHYSELQEVAEKTGLFRVEQVREAWTPTLIDNGKITNSKDTTVVISDQHKGIEQAIKEAASAATSSGFVAGKTLKSTGFDLHFTRGEKKIGGMRQLKQAKNSATDSTLTETATKLANSMSAAVAITGVKWISEGGGSGVLTQAMQILKNQNVNFSGAQHSIFFDGVTTNIAKAEQLARDIGLPIERSSHKKSLFNLNQALGSGIGGGFVTAYQTYRQDKKQTALKFGMDIVKEFGAHTSALGTLGVTGSAIGTAATFVGLGATVTAATAALAVATTALALPASIAFGLAVAPKVISGLDAFAQANFEKYNDLKAKYL